jgi:hypothetical protein
LAKASVAACDASDRTAFVAVEVAAVGKACPFIPDERIISGPVRTVDIAALEDVARIIFSNQRVTVILEAGDSPAAVQGGIAGFKETAKRIIDERGRPRAPETVTKRFSTS